MNLRCVSCAAEKKKKTATLLHEGDSLCAECYEKKLAYKRAENENAARMQEIERRLNALAGEKKK